jgi:hypothetical protein
LLELLDRLLDGPGCPDCDQSTLVLMHLSPPALLSTPCLYQS